MCFFGQPSVSTPQLPPPPPAPPPPPTIADVGQTSRLDDERRRKLAAQQGRQGTVLTNPLGLDDEEEAGESTLLTS